jgi:hypothetical protein
MHCDQPWGDRLTNEKCVRARRREKHFPTPALSRELIPLRSSRRDRKRGRRPDARGSLARTTLASTHDLDALQ